MDTPTAPTGPAPLLERSASFGKVALALAQAQGDFQPIEKNCVARIHSKKTGTSYTFEYADLAAIREATAPHLAKAGLALVPSVSTEPSAEPGLVRVLVQHELIHGESGEWFRTPLLETLIDANEIKELGGAITYLRRYQIQTLLGISSEADRDADGVGERKETYRAAPPSPGAPSAPSGRFKCRFGHPHASMQAAKDCAGDGEDRTLEPGEDPPSMAAPPVETKPDALEACRAAITKKDWRGFLTTIGSVPPAQRKQLEAEYQAARYPKEKAA